MAVVKNIIDGSLKIDANNTITNCTLNVTGVISTSLNSYYTITGDTVCLFIPAFNGSSNTSDFIYIQIPNEIVPVDRQFINGLLASDDSGVVNCVLNLESESNSLKLYSMKNYLLSNFTTSTTGSFNLINSIYIFYQINN